MSAHTASHAAHGAHDAHGHSGMDPMVLKMGILAGAIVMIVVVVLVFSYARPSFAGMMPAKAKNPIILEPQAPARLANSCEHFVFEYLITGYRKCR